MSLRTAARRVDSIGFWRVIWHLRAAGARIHSRDTQKTLRALELRLLTRQPAPPATSARPLEGYSVLKIGLDPDRAALHQRLEARTQLLFKQGLIEEVEGLLRDGCTGTEKPFESLGYKQALLYLRGSLRREEAIASTLIETRQYAKRQWTWFRRDPEIRWLPGFGDQPEVMEQAAALVEAQISLARR